MSSKRRTAIAKRTAAPVRRNLIVGFFGDIIAELKKVVWPTRQETRRLTLMVLAIAGSVGVILGVIDLGFTYLVNVIW